MELPSIYNNINGANINNNNNNANANLNLNDSLVIAKSYSTGKAGFQGSVKKSVVLKNSGIVVDNSNNHSNNNNNSNSNNENIGDAEKMISLQDIANVVASVIPIGATIDGPIDAELDRKKLKLLAAAQQQMHIQSIAKTTMEQQFCIDILTAGNVQAYTEFFHLANAPPSTQTAATKTSSTETTAETTVATRSANSNHEIDEDISQKENISNENDDGSNIDITTTTTTTTTTTSTTSNNQNDNETENTNINNENNTNSNNSSNNYSENELTTLKKYLTEAEKASRCGDLEKIYDSYSKLAEYFDEKKNEINNVVQFYAKCLSIAKEMNNNLELQAKTEEKLGKIYHKHHQIEKALKHFEKLNSLSKQIRDQSMEKQANQLLVLVYRQLAESADAFDDYENEIQYLTKCSESARICHDWKSEGNCFHKLGITFGKLNNHQKSIDFFEKLLETGKKLNDERTQGIACYSLAHSYNTIGEKTKSIKFLETYLEIAQRNNEPAMQAEACCNLGIIYNAQQDYSKAVHFLERNFEISRQLGDRKALDLARIYLGIARGNARAPAFLKLINSNDINGVLAWKNSRVPFYNTN